jgi:hypothetical protein
VCALSILPIRVSAFFADSIQHIHSLRARGIMSFHAASILGSEARTLRKSSGNLWTAPAGISFLGMVYQGSIR